MGFEAKVTLTFFLLSFISFAIYINNSARRKKIGYVFLGKIPDGFWLGIVILTFPVFMCTVSFYNWNSASAVSGAKRAEPLIIALEEYKADNGVYPAKLKELVPEYLHRVPQPSWRFLYRYGGWDWGNRQQYELEYMIQGTADDYNCYYSIKKKWEVHDSVCPSSDY